MKNQDIDKIISLVMEKQGLIECFLKLTEEQAEAISNYNYDSILSTINKKQNIIEQVNLLDLNNPGITSNDNERLQVINNQTRELMSQAIAIEDENILALKNHRAAIFEKLQNIKQNKLTHSAYRGENLSIEGILIDKKK